MSKKATARDGAIIASTEYCRLRMERPAQTRATRAELQTILEVDRHRSGKPKIGYAENCATAVKKKYPDFKAETVA
ncbi:MAG: hypothetical protein WBC84_00655, partial [Pseudolabrys sp.]